MKTGAQHRRKCGTGHRESVRAHPTRAWPVKPSRLPLRSKYLFVGPRTAVHYGFDVLAHWNMSAAVLAQVWSNILLAAVPAPLPWYVSEAGGCPKGAPMPDAVVVGGAFSGLAVALMLDDLGYRVRVLERDPRPLPGSLAEAVARHRPTVPQAGQSHMLVCLGANLLATHLPQVRAAMLEAGAWEVRLAMPPALDDPTPLPEDAELTVLCARRPMLELFLGREVATRFGISVDRGVVVDGLLGSARITGVRTRDGRDLAADLVIDASGRRSPALRWLTRNGFTVPPDEVESAELTYYTRFYRIRDDGTPRPPGRGLGSGGSWDHYSAVLFHGDNGTFSISVAVLPRDDGLTSLRTNGGFTAAVEVSPTLGPWVAVADPISDVAVMGGLDNRLRLSATDRTNPIPGLISVGDSVCTTNPSYGRGMSLALQQIYGLAGVLTKYPGVSAEQAVAVASLADDVFRPWYELSVRNDRERIARWRASIEGREPPAVDHLTLMQLIAAGATDAVVWRRASRFLTSLVRPERVFCDEDIQRRVARALGNAPAKPRVSVPSHAELVQVVTEAARVADQVT
jgi:2-polyprenyl-6-methoxyphenol hydroxylase-like FAD-dependent oxidoreductase